MECNCRRVLFNLVFLLGLLCVLAACAGTIYLIVSSIYFAVTAEDAAADDVGIASAPKVSNASICKDPEKTVGLSEDVQLFDLTDRYYDIGTASTIRLVKYRSSHFYLGRRRDNTFLMEMGI